MHSFVVTGGTQKSRLEKIGSLHKATGMDIMHLADTPLGIDSVKSAISFLSLKPSVSSQKTIIIEDSQKLTHEAQNALLKTLEEPPSFAKIFLVTQYPDSLLPTIISRCQLITLPGEMESTEDDLARVWETISSKPWPDSLEVIEENSPDRESAINFCQNLISYLRKLLPDSAPAIRSLQKAVKLLKSNTHLRLTMDQLLIALKK